MKTLIVFIFVLLFTRAVTAWEDRKDEVVRRHKRLDVASATILIGFMISGASLSHQTVVGLMAHEFSVSVYVEAGFANKPPPPIFPLNREGMAAHKSALSATGSWGSVSWLLGNERLIVMWSVPYSHDWNNNWLAIGMKANHTKEDTKTMLKEEMRWFRKMAYYYGSQTLLFKNDKVVVTAQMGTSHKPVVRVQVYARKWDDLPPKARDQIKKDDYRAI